MLTQPVALKDIGLPLEGNDFMRPVGGQPGFYVAPGTRDLTRTVLERLVDYLAAEFRSSFGQVSTEGGVFGRSDVMRERSPDTPPSVSDVVGPIYWVDSGNSFDPYYVSQLSAQRGLDPRRVLRAIRVARPFTAYQFQRILSGIPETPVLFSSHTNPSPDIGPSSSVEEGDGFTRLRPAGYGGQACQPSVELGRRADQTSWRRCVPLVILSDLMSLFYDDELPDQDCERAFRNFLWQIETLSQRASLVALLFKNEVPVKRQALLPKLLQKARILSLPAPFSIDVSRRAANDNW